MFDIRSFEAKNKLFEFDHQQMNMFEFVRCSKNDVRVRSITRISSVCTVLAILGDFTPKLKFLIQQSLSKLNSKYCSLFGMKFKQKLEVLWVNFMAQWRMLCNFSSFFPATGKESRKYTKCTSNNNNKNSDVSKNLTS